MKLFKSFVAALAIFAFAFVAGSAKAACYDHMTTLKQGSTGAQVMSMQAQLGISADGKFGPMTKAAVMAFQAGNGLTADGVVGPMTGAAMEAACNTTGGSNTGSNSGSNSNLSGGAGDITLDDLSDFSGEEVGEGQDDAEVMAFSVEADDESDVEINSVKVEFYQDTGADSQDLTDYVESVSVWYKGDMVGEADAEDFSESSDYYSKSISLDGAIVEAGDTEDFTIAVTALNNLDSGDIDTDDWSVDLLSVRFTDGDGVVTTETADAAGTDGAGTYEKNFDFATFTVANDVELKVALEDEAINDARVIDVDDSSDTDGIEILSFTLEAEGSDIEVKDIPVLFTTTGETDEAAIIMNAKLLMDGDVVGTETVPTGGAVTFDDIDVTIDEGEEVEFIVEVKLQDTDGALDNGDTVQAVLGSTQVDAIDAEDASGEDLTASELTGTANADAHAAYDAGIMVDFVSAESERTFTADATGEDDQGTYRITFEVTAFDGDMYIDKSSEVAGADAAGQGVEFAVTSTAGTPVLGSNLLESDTTESEDNSNVFYVEEGSTREFTLVVIYAADTTPTDGSHTVAISSINWGTASDNTNANYYTFNLNDFKTNSLFLNGIA